MPEIIILFKEKFYFMACELKELNPWVIIGGFVIIGVIWWRTE